MEISGEFVKKIVTEIKEDKEKLKREFNIKLDLLGSFMNTNLSMLEQTLRINFPTMQTFCQPQAHSFLYHQIDNNTESKYILSDNDDVSKEFKRHVEFLKIVSNSSNQMFNFEKAV